MKKLQLLILNCLIIVLSSCDSFLDIVPDDIATIDNAFTMRAQAEKYLFTCYYYLPAHGLLEAACNYGYHPFEDRRLPEIYPGVWVV